MTDLDKAKAYDEVLERAKEQLDGAKVFDYKEEQIAHDIRQTVYYIFPELKESEDEKIRKALISTFQNRKKYCIADTFGEVSVEDALAWLEKQKPVEPQQDMLPQEQYAKAVDVFIHGKQKPIIVPKFRVGDTIRIKNSNAEYLITDISGGCYHGKGWSLDIAAGDNDYELVKQKPVEWSEEDEKMLTKILCLLPPLSSCTFDDIEHWLKSLKDRCIPQPKQEWSEEDEDRLNKLVGVLKQKKELSELGISTGYSPEFWEETIMWLKSLCPQKQWKPSEEQMNNLHSLIYKNTFNKGLIAELYGQLKALT